MTGDVHGPAAARVAGNARWVLFGNVAYAAGQWAQLAILARLGGAAAVGQYAFALALTAPVVMLAGLQARTLQASDTLRAHSFDDYRRLRGWTTALAVGVILLLGLLAGSAVSWSVLLPVCVLRAADQLSDIYYGEWQRHERMRVNGLCLALNALASVAFMGAAAVLALGVAWAVAGSALGSCAALAFVHLRTARDPTVRGEPTGRAPRAPRRTATLRLAAEALPLGVIVLLGSLQQNVPRYFVRHLGGEAALGLFAAAYQLTAAGMLVVSALCSAAVPRLAALAVGGDLRGFRALSASLAGLATLLGLAGVGLSWAIGAEVLAIVYRPEFAAAGGMLVVLSLAAGMTFLSSALGSALTAARVIAAQPPMLASTLALLTVACALATPRHGALGAAWSLVLVGAVQALASALLLFRFRAPSAAGTPRDQHEAAALPGSAGSPAGRAP